MMLRIPSLIILFQCLLASASPIRPNSGNAARILMHENKVRYLIARKSDSYYKISKEMGITLAQLHHYNERKLNSDILSEGDIIYLDPRRNKAKLKKLIVLQRSMSARELAQQEALKLKPLMRRNHLSSADEQLPCGSKLFLR